MSEPPWKAFERQIYERLKQGAAADAEISFDAGGRQRLLARFSKIERQVDVLVQGRIGGIGGDRTMVVDCKHWSDSVDVGEVDAFVGFLLDVGAPLGLLVTTGGFSPAAKNRALFQGAPGIDIDVVPFDALALWRPRNPTVGVTSGTDTATFSYWDDAGGLHTEVVDRELAERLLRERGRPGNGCR
jgi:hypothetical protein